MINYTEEQAKEMVQIYLAAIASGDADTIIPVLAKKFGKPEKSIIGKLSKEGVYVKKVYRTKRGEIPVTKKEMIAGLAQIIDADPEKIQGLEKSPKIDLEYLIECVKNAVNNAGGGA